MYTGRPESGREAKDGGMERGRDGMVLSHGALIPEAMGNQSSLELLARWKEES